MLKRAFLQMCFSPGWWYSNDLRQVRPRLLPNDLFSQSRGDQRQRIEWVIPRGFVEIKHRHMVTMNFMNLPFPVFWTWCSNFPVGENSMFRRSAVSPQKRGRSHAFTNSDSPGSCYHPRTWVVFGTATGRTWGCGKFAWKRLGTRPI